MIQISEKYIIDNNLISEITKYKEFQKNKRLEQRQKYKNNEKLESKQCDKCGKILSRNYIFVKHKEKCKGKINPLECIYCKFLFTTSSAKSRHQKTCKEKYNSNPYEDLNL